MATSFGPPINDAVPLTFKVSLTLPIQLGGLVASIALLLLTLYLTRSTFYRLFPPAEKPDPNPNITLSRRPTGSAATLGRGHMQPYDEFADPGHSLPISTTCAAYSPSNGKRPSTAQKLGRMLTTVRRAKSQRHHQHMQELLAKQQTNMQTVVAAANAANNSFSADSDRASLASSGAYQPRLSSGLTSSLFTPADGASSSSTSSGAGGGSIVQPAAAWRPMSDMPPMPPLPSSVTMTRADSGAGGGFASSR
ncbi:hypothetical protein BCR44DRAFT_43803 [Catenaria anguillulae PL171]|uniref:Uncharacterized protein n=1 Tax=Catenaria anguillulae PL171 TaxID=765915 RepID=A0A1Y2HKJ4_9FUNG|nr:hypothetical protein BCR44DRAFT_43803 [Catenaria anguillulae PL171]